MARIGILRVMFIVVVASRALSYYGSCATNEAKAERKAPPADAPKMKNNVLRVDLIRRDSPLSPLVEGQSLSNAERLRLAIQRSHNRLRRFQHYTSQNAKSYYTPISSSGEGEFLMQMAIGSPVPLNLHFILDTGSDLIWTQCQPCSVSNTSCELQKDPMYNPFKSSSYTNVSCSNHFCLALSRSTCDFRGNCNYTYSYADDAYTRGVLAYEMFSLATAGFPTWTSFLNLTFGCGRVQGGPMLGSAGTIGMARGPLSLVSQIGSSIDHIFSYCLGSRDNASQISPLFLGRAATLGAGFRVTSIIPDTDLYYLDLRGISVDGKAVIVPNGTFEIQPDRRGGLIIDSGTTLTYLEDPGYKPFLNAVRSSIPANAFATTVLDLCYNATPALRFPTITFHFAGDAKYVLPPTNSFVSLSEDVSGGRSLNLPRGAGRVDLSQGGVVCLAFKSSGMAGSTSIFGNIQQQNFHIVYDLGHNKLYFAPTNCASI